MHGCFFDNSIKSWKISLVTYKNMSKVEAVPTRVPIHNVKILAKFVEVTVSESIATKFHTRIFFSTDKFILINSARNLSSVKFQCFTFKFFFSRFIFE